MNPVILIFFMSFFYSLSATEIQISSEQEREWIKLYPKLNSKMARMEEILNFIERFFPSEEFHEKLLKHSAEFTFLVKQASYNLPPYLEEKEKQPFLIALEKTAHLGQQLYQALKDQDQSEVKEVFAQLDSLRRKSHSEWAL